MSDAAAESRITELESQERELTFAGFDLTTAWHLGQFVMQTVFERDLRLTVDIRRPNVVLFRGVGPRCTPDQQRWIERKSALTLRTETSSALFAARMALHGFDPTAVGWLDAKEHALAPGSFPIRVRGTGVVAAISASGLPGDEDHDVIVELLSAFLVAQERSA